MLWLFVSFGFREVHDNRIIVTYLREAVDHEASSEMKLIQFVYEAAQKFRRSNSAVVSMRQYLYSVLQT